MFRKNININATDANKRLDHPESWLFLGAGRHWPKVAAKPDSQPKNVHTLKMYSVLGESSHLILKHHSSLFCSWEITYSIRLLKHDKCTIVIFCNLQIKQIFNENNSWDVPRLVLLYTQRKLAFEIHEF